MATLGLSSGTCDVESRVRGAVDVFLNGVRGS
jgi:hypothetical protein